MEAVVEEGGEIGRVNVILTWDDRSDLDLAVRCPTGEEINYNKKRACGGELDTDANSNDNTRMTHPVENVVFDDFPQPGAYTVKVYLFKQHAEAGKPLHRFTVTIVVDGEETVRDAWVSMDDRQWTTEFYYGGNP